MKSGNNPVWYTRNNQWYCNKCYQRIFISPKHNPTANLKKITYKGKQVYVGFNPRTGICSECGHKGRTEMHHINYHDEDILKDTIELCVSCHGKKRIGMKYNKNSRKFEINLVENLVGFVN